MPSFLESLKAFSIYDYMIVFLVTLGVAADVYLNVFASNNPAMLAQGFGRLLLIPAFAGLMDYAIKKFFLKKYPGIPKTALISGLFVAGILDPSTPLPIPFIAVALAILSKHLFRAHARNAFNPAAFGIAITGILFTYFFGINVVGSWWIASTLLTVPFGLFISYKMEKLPLTFSFFAAYAVTLAALFGQPLNSIFQPVFVSAFLFFASFMLIEPRTSPYTFRGMVLSGICTGVLSAWLPGILPPMEYVLVSLLAMNLFKGVLDKKLPNKMSA